MLFQMPFGPLGHLQVQIYFTHKNYFKSISNKRYVCVYNDIVKLLKNNCDKCTIQWVARIAKYI